MSSIGESALKSIIRLFPLLFGSRQQWRGFGELWRAIQRLVRRLRRRERRPRRPRGDCCIHVPADVYKRPDPLLYAQFYLMSMGLAVVWDNPDIQIYEPEPLNPETPGNPVSSSQLEPNHQYVVVVRVWNGSYDAPALGLPVHLSYLSFGVGTVSTTIGTTLVDLGVKGSPSHPVFAVFPWRTPVAGHYCLQASLQWADDANPDNNLGQENVEVGVAQSPAHFSFPLRNTASVRRRFLLEVDTYRLPDLSQCDEAEAPDRRGSRLAESRARWERTRRHQSYGDFPVPADWNVVIEPADLLLAPSEERIIEVSIEPLSPAVAESLAFNINAIAIRGDGLRHLAGGVTLPVTKT